MEKTYGGQQAAQNRTETSIEHVIARLGTIVNRIDSSVVRATTVANAVLGYQGEDPVNGLKAPAQIATSFTDYLNEIDASLCRLDQQLNRLT